MGSGEIMVINGYGQGTTDSVEIKKNRFLEYLYEEVNTAENLEIPIIIQIDSNLHLGNTVVLNDPNVLPNSIGKCMLDFLKRTNLTLVNPLDICEGLKTRSRTTVTGEEKSVLDFFLVKPYGHTSQR